MQLKSRLKAALNFLGRTEDLAFIGAQQQYRS